MQSIRGASDLAKFILKNYSGKVVEVGTGFVGDVASRLSALNIIATDTTSRSLDGLLVEKDDIFFPRIEIYKGASLLYSIRPPIEIQLAIGKLALKVGADVLIRPLGDEIADLPGFTRSLINAGEARFYLFRPNR